MNFPDIKCKKEHTIPADNSQVSVVYCKHNKITFLSSMNTMSQLYLGSRPSVRLTYALCIFSIMGLGWRENSDWKHCDSFFFLHFFDLFVSFFLLLLFKYSCMQFPPTMPMHPGHPHLPPLISLPPLGFVHVSFIVVPENPSPLSFQYPLPPPLF